MGKRLTDEELLTPKQVIDRLIETHNRTGGLFPPAIRECLDAMAAMVTEELFSEVPDE